MENEKKSSRLGVRLSAVMVAVFLVVCMAVPAFALDYTIPDYPTIYVPDDVAFGVIYLRNENGRVNVAYTYQDVEPFVQLGIVGVNAYDGQEFPPVPQSRFNENHYWYVCGYASNLPNAIISCRYPLTFDGTNYYAPADNKKVFVSVFNYSTSGGLTGGTGYYTDEETGKLSGSFKGLYWSNVDVYSPDGELAMSAGEWIKRLYFTPDKTPIEISFAGYTPDSTGDVQTGTYSFITLTDPVKIYYSSQNIYDSSGSLVKAGDRSFVSSVGYGLTVVLDWVGATVSALFSGSLSGLLPLVAVPVAITLLLVAIIVIKRSIWGA